MEIAIAAAFSIWTTFFAVWAFLKVKKDYKDINTSGSSSAKKEETKE